jgi:hypothetical protein
MNEQSDDSRIPAEQALEDLKQRVGHAITQAEDAIERVSVDMTAAAKVAEDYRAKMFEYMRANVNAALDYANSITSVKSPVDLVGLVSGKPPAPVEPGATAPTSDATQAAEVYRQKMFDFMKSNLNAALDYAEKLSAVKTPSEFIELSTSHARKQFETVTAQTTELSALARKLTAWNHESLGAFTKLFTPPKS